MIPALPLTLYLLSSALPGAGYRPRKGNAMDEMVRVNGEWAQAAEVEAYLVKMLGPEMAAHMMEAARENAKLTDEEIKAAVARMWDEVLRR